MERRAPAAAARSAHSYSMFFGLSRGSARGEVHNPFGIARRGGITFVAHLNNARVNVYGPTGASRGQVGRFGEAPGAVHRAIRHSGGP